MEGRRVWYCGNISLLLKYFSFYSYRNSHNEYPAKSTCSTYAIDGMRNLFALQWRHNERDGVSNDQPHHCFVYSGAHQRKHQSCAPLAFVRRLQRGLVNSPHKGSVTLKMFPFDCVIIEFVSSTSFQVFDGVRSTYSSLQDVPRASELDCLFKGLLCQQQKIKHLNSALLALRVGNPRDQPGFPSQKAIRNHIMSGRVHVLLLSPPVNLPSVKSLQWRYNGRDCVSDHQSHHCLLNRLFRCWSKKTPGADQFPAQMAHNAENVSIWWRHHVSLDPSDVKPTLVQVMALCRKAPCHYLGHCWFRSLPPSGVTETDPMLPDKPDCTLLMPGWPWPLRAHFTKGCFLVLRALPN